MNGIIIGISLFWILGNICTLIFSKKKYYELEREQIRKAGKTMAVFNLILIAIVILISWNY